MRKLSILFLFCSLVALAFGSPARADSFFFSTGNPDGKIATASGGSAEAESADDFVLAEPTRLLGGSFTGLFAGTGVALPTNVTIEFYRVFPLDSGVPPSGHVPTRVNSPSDVDFMSFDSGSGALGFSTNQLAASFTALNSVVTGIHPIPGQNTGGDGSVSGTEVRFDFTFAAPPTLDAGHYFFVPVVDFAANSGREFLWLSAPRPIVAPGTPFSPDLQSWIRNEALQPDWLRVGTDIVGQGATFNAAFSLVGATVPEPAEWALMICGFGVAGLALRRTAEVNRRRLRPVFQAKQG